MKSALSQKLYQPSIFHCQNSGEFSSAGYNKLNITEEVVFKTFY